MAERQGCPSRGGIYWSPKHWPDDKIAGSDFEAQGPEPPLKGAPGRSLRHTIDQLTPSLCGWAAYFKLTETTRELEEWGGWLRRKRLYTRARSLMRAGLVEERAFCAAFNPHGPWWNSGASHLNQTFRKSYFDRLGLVSLLDTVRRLRSVS